MYSTVTGQKTNLNQDPRQVLAIIASGPTIVDTLQAANTTSNSVTVTRHLVISNGAGQGGNLTVGNIVAAGNLSVITSANISGNLNGTNIIAAGLSLASPFGHTAPSNVATTANITLARLQSGIIICNTNPAAFTLTFDPAASLAPGYANGTVLKLSISAWDGAGGANGVTLANGTNVVIRNASLIVGNGTSKHLHALIVDNTGATNPSIIVY